MPVSFTGQAVAGERIWAHLRAAGVLLLLLIRDGGKSAMFLYNGAKYGTREHADKNEYYTVNQMISTDNICSGSSL